MLPKLKANVSKKPAKKSLLQPSFEFPALYSPLARGKIAREIQNSIEVKNFLVGFLERFHFNLLTLTKNLCEVSPQKAVCPFLENKFRENEIYSGS